MMLGGSPLDLASRARLASPGLVAPPKPAAVVPKPAPQRPMIPTVGGMGGTTGVMQRALAGMQQRPTMPKAQPTAPVLPKPQQPPPPNVQVPPPGQLNEGAPPPISVQPPVPQQPAAPAGPPGPITDFGPGNDLRSSQINPLASDRLKTLQGTVDQSASQVGQGPSLSDAAASEFDLLGQKNAQERKLGIQDIGRAAAKFGRIGSGMVTTDLGNLEDVLRTREEQARQGLSADVARGEAENRRANLSSVSGLEGQVYGQEAGQRGELRGERGYQSDTAQQALENKIRQKALEESLTQGQFGRDLAGGQLGMQGAELQTQTAQGEQQAAGDVLSNLGLQDSLSQYMKAGGANAGANGPPRLIYQNGKLVPAGPQ